MDPDDGQAGGPSPFSVSSVYPAETGATNPELAAKFLAEHRGAMNQRTPEIDNVLSKMQLNTDSMTKILDDTTAAIKASRDGGRGGANLPLMAMAAGMMSGRGNFGSQVGEGLGKMVPTIQAEREGDQQMNYQLAQLALKRAGIENVPLEAKLAYMKAMQMGDLTATRSIEQALIKSQAGAGRNDIKEAQLLQKTTQQALEEARKSVANESTEMYATDEDRKAAIRQRFIENIKVQQAAGTLTADQAGKVIGQVVETMGGNKPSTATRKSFFNAPTSPEAVQLTVDKGLPAPPAPYIYENVGPKERPKLMESETSNFRKETKDWDTTSETQRGMLDKIGRIEKILDKNPTAVGPRGPIPNKMFPNMTEDAQTLQALTSDLQIHNIPKGQGSVSDRERELFANAGASMNINAAANRNILNINKEIIKRDVDRRAFFNEYFNTYRTMDGMVPAWDRYINSPAGSTFTRDGAGNPVPNANRMPWREFFKTERAAPPEPVRRAKGGYIKLGAEYDD